MTSRRSCGPIVGMWAWSSSITTTNVTQCSVARRSMVLELTPSLVFTQREILAPCSTHSIRHSPPMRNVRLTCGTGSDSVSAAPAGTRALTDSEDRPSARSRRTPRAPGRVARQGRSTRTYRAPPVDAGAGSGSAGTGGRRMVEAGRQGQGRRRSSTLRHSRHGTASVV